MAPPAASSSQPVRQFFPLEFGGVLDESKTPRRIGSGLVAARNLMHRRTGAWAKRPGSGVGYEFPNTGPMPNAPSSAIRWYRGYPTPLTQTVVVAQGAMYVGGDPAPNSVMSEVASFPSVAKTPVRFCSARDPLADTTNGSDVLILCGLSGPYGFATGLLTLNGTPSTGDTIAIELMDNHGNTVTTAGPYTVLPNDNLASIAAEIVDLINESAACVNGGNGTISPGPTVTPFMNQALSSNIPEGATTGTVTVAALASGTTGNAYQYKATVTTTGGSLTITPSSFTNLTGGGTEVTNPLKWDGQTLSGLSPYITNAFTLCASWHSHVWFAGDPNNPDTVFATDINTAEGWSFMTQNGGGGSTGGYDVGAGDGDAYVRAFLPIGDVMYVFKGAHIYAFAGYDFQQGEYAFSVEPAVVGHGTPTQECVTRLANAAVFWDGARFLRLAVGAFDVEPIGGTIPFTSGKVIKGNQSLMRCAAGDFAVPMAPLYGQYGPPGQPAPWNPGKPLPEVMQTVVFFAVDIGNGIADTVLVYDDAATTVIGEYAWQVWTGWTVGAFLPFTKGVNSVGNLAVEPPYLLWVPIAPGLGGSISVVNQFGVSATRDGTAPIPWSAQTGWFDLGTPPGMTNDLHRVFVELEATPGVNMAGIALKSAPLVTQPPPHAPQPGVPSRVPPPGGYTSTTQRPLTFMETTGTQGIESFQEPLALVNPSLKNASAVMLFLSEAGTDTTFEVTGALVDCIQNPQRP